MATAPGHEVLAAAAPAPNICATVAPLKLEDAAARAAPWPPCMIPFAVCNASCYQSSKSRALLMRLGQPHRSYPHPHGLGREIVTNVAASS